MEQQTFTGNKGLIKYFAGIICDQVGSYQFEVKFLKCNHRSYFVLDDNDVDDVEINEIVDKINDAVELNQRNQYNIRYEKYNLE